MTSNQEFNAIRSDREDKTKLDYARWASRQAEEPSKLYDFFAEMIIVALFELYSTHEIEEVDSLVKDLVDGAKNSVLGTKH